MPLSLPTEAHMAMGGFMRASVRACMLLRSACAFDITQSVRSMAMYQDKQSIIKIMGNLTLEAYAHMHALMRIETYFNQTDLKKKSPNVVPCLMNF